MSSNNNNKASVVYRNVAVNDTSSVSSSSSNRDRTLAEAAPPPLPPASPVVVHRRAFSLEPGGGRRRQGALTLTFVQEENKNRLRMQSAKTHNHSNDDNNDASSSNGSRDDDMFEQEFDATHDNMMHHGRHTNTIITVRQAFVHLLKGYVGPGCLSLPWAMSQLGVSVGIVMIFIVCLWSSYNCRVVLLLKRHYQKAQNHQNQNQSPAAAVDDASRSTGQHDSIHNNHSITYPQLADWLYPGRGRYMHRFTTLCICIQQLAVCTVFLSFTGTNLQALFFAVWDINLSHQVVIALALPAVLALSCLPNLKALAPVTFFATLLLMLGFTLIGVVIAMEWNNNQNNHDDDDPSIHSQHSQYSDSMTTTTSTTSPGPNYRNWPTAICAILYSFEGICLVLPVEQAMEPRQAKRHFMTTFAIAMITASMIFATLSYFCVAAFGPITNGSITAFLLQKYGGHDHSTNNNSNNDHDNMTHNGRHFLQDAQEQEQQPYLMDWLLAANAAVSLSVLITYPLQIFPALELAEPILNPHQSTGATDRLELIPQQDDDDNDIHHPHPDVYDNINSHASPDQDTASVCDNRNKKNHEYYNADGNSHDEGRLPFRMVAQHQQPSSQRVARGKATIKNDSNGLSAAKDQGITTPMEISAADENAIAATHDNDDDNYNKEDDDNVASVKTRIILVLSTFFVAVAVPNVQVLISLAGALAGSSVALLIPPALEVAWLFKCQEQTAAGLSGTTTPPQSKFTRDLTLCYILFAFGFLFLCIGTGASLLDIYETNRHASSATDAPNEDRSGP